MFEENRLAEVCPHCCRSLSAISIGNKRRSLFIISQEFPKTNHNQQQRTRESHQMLRCHPKQVVHRNISYEKSTNSAINSISKLKIGQTPTLAFLLIALLCLAIIWPQARGQQAPSSLLSQEIRANLPTVIVRGFLNYRTTVDGTVLLFTPDAGGSSSSSGISVAPSTTANSNSIMMSSRTATAVSDQQIEPTSIFHQTTAATATAFESASEAGWRPVQATPPLNSMETVLRTRQPAGTLQVASGAWEQPDQSSHTPQATAPMPMGQQELMSSQAQFSQPIEGSSTPSVQSDDILVAGGDGPQHQAVAAASTTKAPVDLAASRTGRPKRPSLGFNGQAIRAAGQRSDRARAQTGNQNEAQTFNTINGIRRPGLSTTPSPAAGASDSDQLVVSTNAPASRSSVAGAKLRNRFKRPPTSGSTPAHPTTLAPITSAAITSNVTFLQSAESGDEPVIGTILSSPAVATFEVAASPAAESAASIAPPAEPRPSGGGQMTELESRMGDQAALQARLGDLFGPSSASSNSGTTGGHISASPAVGSDEVLIGSSGSSSGASLALETAELPDSKKLLSRSGDQPPSPDMQQESHLLTGGLSGELQQGVLGTAPLSFDAFFQGDQPQQSESTEHRAHHQAKESAISTASSGGGNSAGISSSKKNHNDRLNGRLEHLHNNKHIPRPLKHQQGEHEAGHLSQQLAANLNSLAPSFVSNIPNSLRPTPVQHTTQQLSSEHPMAKSEQQESAHNNTSTNTTSNLEQSAATEVLQLQTLTRTYSTTMTSTRTRLVPLQVKSSTAVHTITENYVITKVLTAYQTMPVGEFILPEPQSTRSPFEMFNETPVAPDNEKSLNREQPIAAPSNFVAPAQAVNEMQEQPISLEQPKNTNDWLHDFNNLNNINNQQNQQQLQQNHLAALLEQQAQENNLAGFTGLEPLEQLASSLDPAALLNDGHIQIPDLNNPIVLAAAIQNPQLAAVILAAQQLQLKQRGNKLASQANQANGQHQQQQQLMPAQLIPLQPSYSTTFTVQVKPSTYTVRDTMFTTRLVSFKDGRTVRTRTVSEPGSVIEQVLTTTVTETTPVTLTIRPTGMLTLPGPGSLATAAPPSNQATISNALIATQLANLLSRRQQQVQPSGLAALQQLLAGQQSNNALTNQLQQQQQRLANNQQQLAKQFQPNFQNLLQSLQQQQQLQQANSPSVTSSPTPPVQQQQQQQQQQNRPSSAASQPAPDKLSSQPTPSLVALPTQPFVTTLTNLQVRTYTVHNAFKTIFRTITSTQLITSTIFPAGMTRSLTLVG